MNKIVSSLIKFCVALFVLFLVFIVDSVFLDKIVIFLVLLVFLFTGLRYSYRFNPYFFFIPAPLSLLAYQNIGDAYLLKLTHETYFLGLINFLMFYLMLRATSESVRFKFPFNFRIVGNWYALVGLFVLGKLLSFVSVFQSTAWLLVVIAIVGIMMRNLGIGVLFVLINVVISVDDFSKTALLFYMILFLVVGYSTGRFSQVSYKHQLALLFVLVYTFISSFKYVTKSYGIRIIGSVTDYYRSNGVSWGFTDELFLPYMYLISAWSNLQFVLEKSNSHTWGRWMTKPIVGYFGIFDQYLSDLKLTAYSSFNTFTFISVEFVDFGYFGSLAVTGVLGLLCGRVFVYFLNSPSLYSLSLYVTWMVAVFQMYFSNHFFQLSYPITMLILIYLLTIIRSVFLRAR